MKKIKRILALLLVIFLIAMVFVTLYWAVTGSPYFMAMYTCGPTVYHFVIIVIVIVYMITY